VATSSNLADGWISQTPGAAPGCIAVGAAWRLPVRFQYQVSWADILMNLVHKSDLIEPPLPTGQWPSETLASSSAVDKSVAIVFPIFSHYRLQLFLKLRGMLEEAGIRLVLIYGKGAETGLSQQVEVGWSPPSRSREFEILGKKLIWMDLPREAYTSNLAILIQENRYLSNHHLLWRRQSAGLPTAFWGHGLNHQAHRGSIGNRIKKSYLKKVDWWFAYTKGVARIVEKMGYPAERITIVQNAIDTEGLIAARKGITAEEVSHLRQSLQLDPGPVGIFCGRLYREKRIGFLLSAAARIRAQVPNFQLIIIGSGPDTQLVQTFAQSHPWLHYVGPCYDADRARYFALADIFLMPGLVGLAIVDAFALLTPIFTTSYPYHSPEIEYLVNGENGVMSADNLEDYVSSVVAAIQQPEKMALMKRNCAAAAKLYTIERMASNMASGIQAALAAKRYRA
jgi:glycosyltransferase involved in cell wall biosynthesis